ncbi:hypothetical protein M408DRAFT_28663 [Serendipita vermifera MAFF 305830]|uniref:Uncharacterized protein n=1 Tax=Serendipita vermifera MAFF 305830 TaxID=933852 RepID=A0A0C3ATC7_SERVB|nr:hypothetical protein M408DRAFT_28663 [Serendipita vermifera MAFF 305830]
MATPAQSSHQSQISTTSHLEVQTCKADVIPANQLLEAVYGKLDDVASIRANLEEAQVLSDNGWEDLTYQSGENKSYRPSESPYIENTAFKGLATIFKHCVRAAGIPEAECIVECSVHGNANMATNFPNSTRPDATIHLTKSSFKWSRVRIEHGDVCLYVQFKKKNATSNFEDVSTDCGTLPL